MSLSGSVEDLPLLEILQVVSFCQKTGHLTVQAPQGEAGVVFQDGRVVSGYIWDVAPSAPGSQRRPEDVREHIGTILERLVRLREGAFAFNLTTEVPVALAGRDLSADTLEYGINPEEMMLDLARKLDEDRRDCTASLAASFAAPEPLEDAAERTPAAPVQAQPGRTDPPLQNGAEEPPLPQVDPDAAAADAGGLEEIDLPGAARTGGQVVLLVDDEPEVCGTVGERLAADGFEITTAGSAGEARREMQRLSSEGRAFLLVVDLGLPSETGSSFRGGLDVARMASGLPCPPPVLLMSEAIDEKLMGRARRLGVSLLAFKPGISKLDPLQYAADLRAFAGKLARDLLPRLAGRRGHTPLAPAAPDATQPESRETVLQKATAEIEAQPDPDLVAFLLLRVARACFTRALLFVVNDDRLRGLSGFGPTAEGRSLDLLAREILIPLEAESPFRDAIASGQVWSGPLEQGGPVGQLLAAIGRPRGEQAALVPLRAAGETLALVYADAPEGGALGALEPFADFAERAGRALDDALGARRSPARAS